MYDILTNILAFAFALGVIIFVHELGHLVVARLFGIRAHVFSIGYGRRLWGFEWGGTDFRVSALPIGGYVLLGGEDPAELTGDPTEFLSHPRWQRIVVYLAGPAMNILLAIALIAVVFMAGVPVQLAPDMAPVVGSVVAGGPAASAGLEAGDRIVDINGKTISHWADVRFAILTSPARPLRFGFLRDGERHQAVLTPKKERSDEGVEMGNGGIFPVILPRISSVLAGGPAAAAGVKNGDEVRSVDGKPVGDIEKFVAFIEHRAGVPVELGLLRDGKPITLKVVPKGEKGGGKIGVRVGYVRQYGLGGALLASVRYNWEICRLTFAAIGKMIAGSLAAKNTISGPIEIAAMSGEAAREGLEELLYLMGMISVSIALLNLLPIPLLDGGQIFVALIEATIRRDFSIAMKERITQAGFFLLLILMVVITYFDLSKVLARHFSGGG